MPDVHASVLPTSLKPDYPRRYETLIIAPSACLVHCSGVASPLSPPLPPPGKLGTISRQTLAFLLRSITSTAACRGATVQLRTNCYSRRSSWLSRLKKFIYRGIISLSVRVLVCLYVHMSRKWSSLGARSAINRSSLHARSIARRTYAPCASLDLCSRGRRAFRAPYRRGTRNRSWHRLCKMHPDIFIRAPFFFRDQQRPPTTPSTPTLIWE